MDDRPDLGSVMAMMSFAAVVSSGGFSNAAKLLGYSKAAVSHEIAKLEQSIGVRVRLYVVGFDGEKRWPRAQRGGARYHVRNGCDGSDPLTGVRPRICFT